MRIPRWRHLRKPAPLLAAAVALLGLIALAFVWWDDYVEDGLADWAVNEVARQTGGTYRLRLGDLSFLPFAGSISFDSAGVTTDSVRNRRRAVPLPALRGHAVECRVTGLDLVRLLLGRSFHARVLSCRRVDAHIVLAARQEKDSAAADSAGAGDPLHRVVRPLGLSSFRIATLSFPSVSLRLNRPGPRGGASLVLAGARLDAQGIALDPRSVSAERAGLAAAGLVLRPDSTSEISIARLAADFTDSTLALAGAEHVPAIPEGEWVRRVKVRRDRIRFSLDSLHGRGVAYRSLLGTGVLGIRSLELRGATLDVLTDLRIPKGPPRRHRTPQQVAARTGSPIRLDTVLVRGGSIVYRERKPKTERPGVVSFERLSATVRNLDLPSRGQPLRIEASARLMGEGTLSARVTVPLDAPDFRYVLTGRLGGMRAKAFNRFLSVNGAFAFDGGVVEGITFEQTVRGGRAVAAVTPRYRELSVESTGEGGGVVGAVTREVKDFIADAFVVRSRNPDEDGEELRTGRTVRRYSGERTWLQFMWFGIRDGLVAALKE